MDQDSRQIMHGNGQGLLEFCARNAERGELNPTTARAMRVTAGKILAIESPDPSSVDLRTLDVDALLDRFGKLKKADYSEGSLETYRSRFRLAVGMYLAWLADDPKWKDAGRVVRTSKGGAVSPQASRRQHRARSQVQSNTHGSANGSASDEHAHAGTPAVEEGVRLMTYDVPLRPDLIVRVTLPLDLTADDAERFANFVRVLAFSGQTE